MLFVRYLILFMEPNIWCSEQALYCCLSIIQSTILLGGTLNWRTILHSKLHSAQRLKSVYPFLHFSYRFNEDVNLWNELVKLLQCETMTDTKKRKKNLFTVIGKELSFNRHCCKTTIYFTVCLCFSALRLLFWCLFHSIVPGFHFSFIIWIRRGSLRWSWV